MFKLPAILFLFFLKSYARVVYLIKLVVFERESYFWLKRTVMLTFNFDFQKCQKFVP